MVGCIWSPNVCGERGWKVGLGYSTIPGGSEEDSEGSDGEDEDVDMANGVGNGALVRSLLPKPNLYIANANKVNKRNKKGTLIINKRAIINEISRLGGDMLERVEVYRN